MIANTYVEHCIDVDLDGTLAAYDPAEIYEPLRIGTPIAPMIARMRRWLADGRCVRIMTARVAPPIGATEKRALIAAIDSWMQKHVGSTVPISNCKDMHTAEIWDDRAVKVGFNTGEPL